MFCSIIGYPLKKPRSIVLWKKFFRKKKINSRMLPLEIKNKSFNKTIKNLKNDKNFLASAITMPYKIKINKMIDILDISSKLSGSTNLIIKKRNLFYGFNTDIYGFLESLGKRINMKDIIIIGLGGAGMAIFKYIFKKYKKKNFILVTKKRIKKNARLKVYRKINTKKIEKEKKYLIINCTPIGSDLQKSFIKLSPLSSSFLQYINKKSYVFDLIYQPEKNVLYQMCQKKKISYSNGLKMNTYQADKALKIISKLTKFKVF